MPPHDSPDQDGTTASQRALPQIEDLQFIDALQGEPHVPPSPPQRSTRHSACPNNLEYDRLETPKKLKHASVQLKPTQHGSKRFKSYCAAMVSALMLPSGKIYDKGYILNLILTPYFGLYKNLSADTLGDHPHVTCPEFALRIGFDRKVSCLTYFYLTRFPTAKSEFQTRFEARSRYSHTPPETAVVVNREIINNLLRSIYVGSNWNPKNITNP